MHGLTETDSMVSYGAVPWHGLGVTLKEPPATALEALQAADADWTVSAKWLYLEDGTPIVINKETATGVKKSIPKCIIRDDNGEQLGVVGGDYHVYQNRKMAELYQPMIDDGNLTIDTCGTLFGGRRVWMLGRFGDDEQIQADDMVRRYVLLAHGHDGSFAARFGLTPTRVVCWNTLQAAVQDGRSRVFRCLHTAGLEDNLNIIRDGMLQMEEMFQFSAEKYRELASRGVSTADLNKYAKVVLELEEDSKKWTTSQTKKFNAIVSYSVSGIGNQGRNWWEAYNGVTQYLTWDHGRSEHTRLNNVWFGESAKRSQLALDKALEMSA